MAASSWREPEPQSRLVDVRCRYCGKLLFRIDTSRARVEVVCTSRDCKRMQTKLLPERG